MCHFSSLTDGSVKGIRAVFFRRCLTPQKVNQYSRKQMLRRLALLGLIATMLISVVGVGAHQHEGSCPLTNLPDCCKKARLRSKAPETSMARLCCNLNCSEPGSSGGSVSVQFSSPQGATSSSAVVPQPQMFGSITLNSHTRISHLADSNPKYIQHLALLI